MNLIEGIQKELNRARELKQVYDNIPTGFFGSAVIQQAINKAEKCISMGDTIGMMQAYEELKQLE